jgi:hypothetical protein
METGRLGERVNGRRRVTVEGFFVITPILTTFDTVKNIWVWIYRGKIIRPLSNVRRH